MRCLLSTTIVIKMNKTTKANTIAKSLFTLGGIFNPSVGRAKMRAKTKTTISMTIKLIYTYYLNRVKLRIKQTGANLISLA